MSFTDPWTPHRLKPHGRIRAPHRAETRRRAGRSLHKSGPSTVQAGLLRALDASGSLLLLSDARQRITWCNQAFTERFGWTVAQARRRPPGRLLQCEGTDEDTARSIRKALDSGRGYRGQVRIQARDGRVSWLDVDIQPVSGKNGALQGFFAVQTELTDTLQDRDYLRNILNSAVAGLVVANSDHTIVDCNTEAERIFDLPKSRLVGRDACDLRWRLVDGSGVGLAPQDMPWVRALASGEAVHAQLVGLTLADNVRRWVKVSSQRIPARHDSGWAVVSSFIDVTATRQAEVALREAHTQLRGLFDQSPVAMTLSRLSDGVYLDYNAAFGALMGCGREQLGVLKHRDLLPPENRPLAREAGVQLSLNGSYGPKETELLRSDGARVPVMASGILVAAPEGGMNVWSILQDLSAVKHMESRLLQEARTDRLTGLPNRALLMERLEARIARAAVDPAQGFALLFMDIDRFKLVNDTQGHDAGDQFLQVVADRLCGALRASDARGDGDSLVARLGGDEFVVLLADVKTAHEAGRVARRLLDALAIPCMVAQKEVHPSASVGIVIANGDSGSAIHLLRDADMAMYEAKRCGRGNYAVFDRSMLARLSRAVQLESALRHAVAQQQLSLVYQPIVDLHTGDLVSVEALARWRHPELGDVSPAEFIPIAEESGLIVPIGEWVLRQACAQWRRWQQLHPGAAPATMSVNLSRVQMALGERLLALVSQVLAELDMPPAALQLEVTEREVMRDPEAARSLMTSLHGLGVRLAMDDFGTGVSSLGCLRDYPFDVIKIDKSFIDNVADSQAMLAVLQGTVMVIENLGMVSVAEGVEDAVQLGVLQSLGCHYGQGYYFSRPVPAEQLLNVRSLTPSAA